jgi:WD40 repeat protein
VHAVDITPDGRFAAAAYEDQSVWFWDLTEPNGRCLHAGGENPGGRSRVRLTPDGRRAVHVGQDGGLRLTSTDGKQHTSLDESTGDGPIAVSVDGRRALSVGRYSEGSRTSAVRVWDLASGSCERELAVPGLMVTALCFGADGRFAATASFEMPIHVWDLDDGHCAHVLASETTPDTLSISGRLLLSGSKYDNSVRLWELERGRCLRTFPAHQNGTTVVHLDTDGRIALSTGQDGTAVANARRPPCNGAAESAAPACRAERSGWPGRRSDSRSGASDGDLPLSGGT